MKVNTYDQPDNVYLDIRIDWKDVGTVDQSPILAIYDVTRDSPVLRNPDQYYVSIISCAVPLDAVPVVIPSIIPNQPNPNLMEAAVSIDVGAIQYIQNVIYVPPTNKYPAPIQNKPYMVVTKYYYCYDVTRVLNCINTAIANAYIAAGFPGGAGPPYFKFQSESRLFQLIVPDAFITSTARLSINRAAFIYFAGFQYYQDQTSLPGNIFQFVMYKMGNVCDSNGIYNSNPLLNDHWIYEQEFNGVENFLALKRILIGCDSLGLLKSWNTTNTITGNQTGLNPFRPLIHDFFVGKNQIISSSKSLFIYNAGTDSQYRLNDMKLNLDYITDFSLQVFWSDDKDNIYPLDISKDRTVRIKLGFFRKFLYNKLPMIDNR